MTDGEGGSGGVRLPVAPPEVVSGSSSGWRFDEASRRVVEYLVNLTGLGFWGVSRVQDGRELFLTIDSPEYRIPEGSEFPFEDTMCRQMTLTGKPALIPDVRDVPAYARAVKYADDYGVTVNSYVGAPLLRANGELFGTLCGFDPSTKTVESLSELRPLLDLLSGLLSSILQGDHDQTSTSRDLETAHRERDVDLLTGLLNRGGWERFIQHEEARFRRFGDLASVVMLDLNNLKTVNDTQGHDAGDDYLRRAAEAMRTTVRESDVLARLGGDEFGIIAVGATPEQAEILVHRLDVNLTAAGVSSSFGHAPYTVIAGFPGAMREADRLMYESKKQRKEGQLVRADSGD
jgi:diguanylate cyclase